MESHEDILRRHREKFEAHRQWMAEQQQELRDLNIGATPRSSTVGTPHSSRPQFRADVPSAVSASSAVAARGTSWSQSQQYVVPGTGPTASTAGGSPRVGINSARSQQRPLVTGSPLSVHSRSTQWAKRKNQRLEEKRRQAKDVTNDECTFWPQTHRSPSETLSADDTNPIYVKGYEEYLARQELSRAYEAERKRRLQTDGTKWRNEVTVPKEFKLGSRQPEKLTSLRRPIRAPLRHGVNDAHEAVSNEAQMPRFDPFSEARIPMKGAFSERTSVAIIDGTALRQ
jgi:hypothetical protein